MPRFDPWLAVAVALLALIALAAFAKRGTTGASDRVDKREATLRDGSAPEKRCTSNRTYDSIKLELFRSAAQTRGSNRAAFDRISAHSVVRMERPLLTGFDQTLGTTRCSGRLSLDLPPGLAVVGGRHTLTADIDYIVQPAADGSGDVVVIEGDGPIMIPLATLDRSGSDTRLASNDIAPAISTSPLAQPPLPPRPDVVRKPLPPVRRAEAAPVRRADAASPAAPIASSATALAPARTATARPSFNCRHARTGGEKAICSNPPLASLDREMAAKYYRAVATGDARQRQRLAATRNDFLRRRDRCSSDACIAASYRERMREIEQVEGR